MYSKAILAAVLGAIAVDAAKTSRTFGVSYFWDSNMVQARMDPIINPGKEQSAHVHMVVGGDGFSVSMNDDAAANSKCTGAVTKGDKSSYWWPQLYFQDPTTKKFEDVKLHQIKAYHFFEATDDEIKPFPKGLRMVQGDPFLRSQTHSSYNGATFIANGAAVQSVRWSCGVDDTSKSPFPRKADGSPQTEYAAGFPDMKCTNVNSPLASYIHFPSCIDESQPFTSYANNSVFPTQKCYAGGRCVENCPAGYTHVPHLFLEIVWDSTAFNDRWTEGIGKQPFVLANGDNTGYGGHADFISGWDEDVLAHLIATCDAGAHGNGLDSCPGVANFNDASSRPASCSVTPPVAEVVTGKLDKLPGCNPIQSGPAPAVMCDCSSGTPVCNGKAAGSGSGSGSSTPTTTAKASSTTKPVSLPSTSVGDGSGTVTTTAAQTTGTGTTDAPGDDDGEGDDEGDDDDSCDVPEPTTTTTKPIATPVPMIRRSLDKPLYAHQHLHQRRAFKA